MDFITAEIIQDTSCWKAQQKMSANGISVANGTTGTRFPAADWWQSDREAKNIKSLGLSCSAKSFVRKKEDKLWFISGTRTRQVFRWRFRRRDSPADGWALRENESRGHSTAWRHSISWSIHSTRCIDPTRIYPQHWTVAAAPWMRCARRMPPASTGVATPSTPTPPSPSWRAGVGFGTRTPDVHRDRARGFNDLQHPTPHHTHFVVQHLRDGSRFT